jgi:hypothetical protein
MKENTMKKHGRHNPLNFPRKRRLRSGARKDIAQGHIVAGTDDLPVLKYGASWSRTAIDGPEPVAGSAHGPRLDALSTIMETLNGTYAKPVQEDPQECSKHCAEQHEWVVYSTALAEGWLMLQCVECGGMGTIDDPSPQEWSDAFHAPSRPYRWHEGTRVTVRATASPRVIRAVHHSPCDRPSQRDLPETRGYDRVPGGIWEHSDRLTDQDKSELNDFADFIAESDLCSRLVPEFIRCVEADSGHRCNPIIHKVVDRIEQYDFVGLHCSPAVVARIIREYAAWERP